MSSQLYSLSVKEYTFVKSLELPFKCFDGFVVDEQTPYKNIQLLFHFYATAEGKSDCLTPDGTELRFRNQAFWNSDFARFWGDKQALNALALRFSRTVVQDGPKLNYCSLLNDYYGPSFLADVPEMKQAELIAFLQNLLPARFPNQDEELQGYGFLFDAQVLGIACLYLAKGEVISPELAELLKRLTQWQAYGRRVTPWRGLLQAVIAQIECMTPQDLSHYNPLDTIIERLHLELDEYPGDNWCIEGLMPSLLAHRGHSELDALYHKACSKDANALPPCKLACYKILRTDDAHLPALLETQGLNWTTMSQREEFHSELGYPWFKDDPHEEAERWMLAFYHQSERGFYLNDKGELIRSSSSLLDELQLSADNPLCHSLYVACIRRMQWHLYLENEQNYDFTTSGVHTFVPQVLSTLLEVPGLIQAEQVRQFATQFFHHKYYEGLELALVRRLPELIEDQASPLLQDYLVQLKLWLQHAGEFNWRSSRKSKLGAQLIRQYSGWALGCLNNPIDAMRRFFPEYAKTELVAISHRGMPIYDTEYTDYLKCFEQHIFNWQRKGSRLFEESSLEEGSEPESWTQLEGTELAKLIRPVTLGLYWSKIHAVSGRMYEKFLNAVLSEKLPLQERDLLVLLHLQLWDAASGLLNNVERFAENQGLTPKLVQALQNFKCYDDRELIQQISSLINKYG